MYTCIDDVLVLCVMELKAGEMEVAMGLRPQLL